jgi:glycerol-3-phosphate dehydrogenase
VATAAEQGAALINYTAVKQITKDSDGYVNGVVAQESESGTELIVKAKCVINATGAFTDNVRRLAEPEIKPMIAPSQGIHLVFERSIMPGDSAIMVPHTSDGRVMFAIPWHQHVLVGTTDTPIEEAQLDPVPMEHEIEFILDTARQYLSHAPSRKDVLSVFVGIRPLVKAQGAANTAGLSRDHTIHIDQSGLLSICGGKWTTYRHMAEDCVDHAITLARLDERVCLTKNLKIHGHHSDGNALGHLASYGSDGFRIQELIAKNKKLADKLHPALPYCGAEVIWAVHEEMARTVEDFLARRVRALFLNAKAAVEMAPTVAEIMAIELNRPNSWKNEQLRQFQSLAEQYILSDTAGLKRN